MASKKLTGKAVKALQPKEGRCSKSFSNIRTIPPLEAAPLVHLLGSVPPLERYDLASVGSFSTGRLGAGSAFHRDHEDAVAESFRNDPALAAEYLNAVLEDGDQQEVVLAMRRIAEAFGVREVAETASLNAEALCRMLSQAGNPQLSA